MSTIAEGKNFAALSSAYTPEDEKITPTTQMHACIKMHISTLRRHKVLKPTLSAVSFPNHGKLEYIPEPCTSFPNSANGELIH